MMEIVPIVAIAIICWIIGYTFKQIQKFPNQFIPTICAVCGALLGVVAWYCGIDIKADNWLVAIGYGVLYGVSATGCNELIKQIKEFGQLD